MPRSAKFKLDFQVNVALMELIKASKSKLKPEEWSHIPERQSGNSMQVVPMLIVNIDVHCHDSLPSFSYYLLSQ